MPSDLAIMLSRSIQKGESLEKAKSSLINAGYSPQEVQDAINETQNLPKQTPQISMPPIMNRDLASKQVIQTQKTVVQTTTQVIPSSAPQPVYQTVQQSQPIQQSQESQQAQYKPLNKSTQTDFAFVILVIFIIVVISGAITTGVFFQQIKQSLFG
jgi:FtsZ-interacting cell division protein ZipA